MRTPDDRTPDDRHERVLERLILDVLHDHVGEDEMTAEGARVDPPARGTTCLTDPTAPWAGATVGVIIIASALVLIASIAAA